MGEAGFKVVPADMTHDAAQWRSASAALGRATQKADAAGAVDFGSFSGLLRAPHTDGANAVREFLRAGAASSGAVATNLSNNSGVYTRDDEQSTRDVGGAAQGGSGGSGGSGSGEGNDDGGKYATILGPGSSVPTDPKDPSITFDRHVDPQTGEVAWTARELKPGEGSAVDGRDVERIPTGAERIVVTMVDGEPRITYADRDDVTRWVAREEAPGTERIVAGSGAVEPSGVPVRTEWSRALPPGADYAVVELRNGEPHLVFLDVEGGRVEQVSDHVLPNSSGPTQPTYASNQGA